MRFFFDTEFVEDGKTIDLISIAIVAEDGREYFAVSTQFNQRRAKAHPFVSEHVLPKLPKRSPSQTDSPRIRMEAGAWKPRAVIAREIQEFVGNDPEFWADFAAYDWVALCQLYGTMMDLPKGWPFFCRDVQQFRKMLNVPKFTVDTHREHDALADAKECKARHDVLQQKLAEWVTTR